mgnify:CR=1 FL=1
MSSGLTKRDNRIGAFKGYHLHGHLDPNTLELVLLSEFSGLVDII